MLYKYYCIEEEYTQPIKNDQSGNTKINVSRNKYFWKYLRDNKKKVYIGLRQHEEYEGFITEFAILNGYIFLVVVEENNHTQYKIAGTYINTIIVELEKTEVMLLNLTLEDTNGN